MELAIEKKHLIVRPAWEVGLNEFETVAIQPGDKPMIPEGKSGAPILAVLHSKSSREKMT